MATLASFLSSSLLVPSHRYRYHHRFNLLFRSHQSLQLSIATSRISLNPKKIGTLLVASSSTDASFDELNPREDSLPDSSPKKSVLSTLIQEIEPLDVSRIQKDVPLTTVDAMKRTISGMLGLLPSNQFQVHIEALWEPLSKLLISSMMTGYTLRNAEYRLCMERNLDIYEQNSENQMPDGSNSKLDMQEFLLDNAKKISFPGEGALSSKFEELQENRAAEIDVQGLSDISREAQEYILHLQSRLSTAKKELHEVKRKNAALQMQQFVGEEKNDLLDYLRSLQPEKVAELSEPTSPELKETIHSVVYGLLATLSPKIHSKAAPPASSENTSISTISEDGPELLENTSLHFQPVISLTRDYLARLLFWCMLLGHYLRGLEYRLELVELLSLSTDAETDVRCGEQIS